MSVREGLSFSGIGLIEQAQDQPAPPRYASVPGVLDSSLGIVDRLVDLLAGALERALLLRTAIETGPGEGEKEYEGRGTECETAFSVLVHLFSCGLPWLFSTCTRSRHPP